jgi:uncharacterized protein YjlB
MVPTGLRSDCSVNYYCHKYETAEYDIFRVNYQEAGIYMGGTKGKRLNSLIANFTILASLLIWMEEFEVKQMS